MQTVEELINSLTPDACRDLARNKSAIPICRKAAADKLVEKRHPHRHHPEVAEIAALPLAAFLSPQPPPAKDEVIWPTYLSDEVQAEIDRLIAESEGSGPLQASVTTETMLLQEEVPPVVETLSSPPSPEIVEIAEVPKSRKSKKETPAIKADPVL